MFLIREAFPEDLDQLLEIAGHLDTVNLPHDRAILERLLEHSHRSFAGHLDVWRREYLFVLVDIAEQRLVGTCMIHAKHGTRKAPHIFYDVLSEERYSDTLDRHVVHRCLRIGHSYDGPTEIGGLILLPGYRGHPRSLGKLLSYVRFLYIGLHRDRFRDEVLSELLPPLEPDGTSLLWECLGRHFTGLGYQEADRLSQHNKEFIRTLFPHDMLYTCLMPEHVQAIIGQVGPETRGVEKMLRKIGFEYAERIDPFDGGPHFTARTEDITLIRDTRRARVAGPDGGGDGGARRVHAIVAAEREAAPRFAAVGGSVRLQGDGATVVLDEKTRAALGVSPGDNVGYVLS